MNNRYFMKYLQIIEKKKKKMFFLFFLNKPNNKCEDFIQLTSVDDFQVFFQMVQCFDRLQTKNKTQTVPDAS